MLTLWILSIIVTLYIADRKKLGVVGFFFVSLFIGPLAVIIVLLMPSREVQSGTVFAGSTLSRMPRNNWKASGILCMSRRKK